MATGYTRPEASGLSKKQVFEFAEMVAERFDVDAGDDLYDFVSRIGGEIVVADTFLDDPAQSGSLYVDAENSFRIVISSHTSPKRDRFTIAHELGHFFLHYILPQRYADSSKAKMFALRKDSDRIEWEANWFASAFLMPEIEFKEIHSHYNGDIEDVADHFDVSVAAAEIRAKSLNLSL